MSEMKRHTENVFIMNTYCTQIVFLLTMLVHGSEHACAVGWFGFSCKMQCHCIQSVTCDGHGRCSDNQTCARPYFGTGCQFVDRVSSEANVTVPLYIRDFDDLTCNPNDSETSVEINLLLSVPFSWFRLVVNDSRNIQNFTTILNSVTPCNIERKFVVDEYVVDVTCDTHIPVNKIRIEGAVTPNICSMYVSLGRNVATREHTQQSSTFNNELDFYGSKNAVDGNTQQSLDSHSCAHSDLQQNGAWWFVNFTYPVILHYIRVTNRNNYASRLDEFTLAAYIMGGVEESLHTGGFNIVTQSFFITSLNPIRSIVIRQSQKVDANERYLSLCEVEAFGHRTCDEGFHGLECSNHCNCNKTEVCNENTGLCAPGCPPGFYEYACISFCVRNCLSNICAYKTGYCIECEPGYIGVKCNRMCNVGMYGLKCSLFCSVGCDTICDPKNGHCSCKTGYKGLLCKECADNFYGELCNKACPSNCSHGLCDKVTGKCVKCRNASVGEMCYECVDTLYGPLCNMDCPVNCMNNICEKMTGNCLKCKGIFTGETCNNCPNKYHGQQCELACPINCVDQVCDKDSGKCYGCMYPFIGDYCNKCPVNMHGPRCSLQCDANCLNRKCDQSSGKCGRCLPGYGGNNCEVNERIPYYWLLLLLFFVLVFAASIYAQKHMKEMRDKDRQYWE